MSRVSGGWLGRAGREGRKRLWDNEPLVFTVVKESREFVTLTTNCLTILYAPFLSHPAPVMRANSLLNKEGGHRCMGDIQDGAGGERRACGGCFTASGSYRRHDEKRWLLIQTLALGALLRTIFLNIFLKIFFWRQWRPSSARRVWWEMVDLSLPAMDAGEQRIHEQRGRCKLAL